MFFVPWKLSLLFFASFCSDVLGVDRSGIGNTNKANNDFLLSEANFPSLPIKTQNILQSGPESNSNSHIRNEQTREWSNGPANTNVKESFPPLPSKTTESPTNTTPKKKGFVQGLINFFNPKASTAKPLQDNKSKTTTSKPNSMFPSSTKVTTNSPNQNSISTSTLPTILSTTKPSIHPHEPTSKPSLTPPQNGNAMIPNNNKPNIPKDNKHKGPQLPSTFTTSRTTTGSKVSNQELAALSEELLRKDSNNVAKYLTINLQGKTTSGSAEDKSPLPLVVAGNQVWNVPTIAKLIALFDNYEEDVTVNEYVTPIERNEENAFLEEVMNTVVIRTLMRFLKEKGYVSPDPKAQRDFLKSIWFNLYSRGKGRIGSSGFEHVFLSERRDGEVLGLHNWIYFTREEAAHRVNYLGYMKHLELNGRGSLVKFHATRGNLDKPVNSLLIGSSPELDMALYTLCYVTRVEEDCPLKLSGRDLLIKTYPFRYRSKNMLGSAFIQI